MQFFQKKKLNQFTILLLSISKIALIASILKNIF